MKKSNKVLIAFLISAIFISFSINKSISQVTDFDGNVYKTLIIGNQEWMAENLNIEHYRNGDVIPQVQDENQWNNLTTGAWCYYENNSDNGKTFGKLYNWYAVNDSRGLAPEGWHIPSDSDWLQLSDYLGGKDVAGGKMKATALWDTPNTGATNESGFTAYPGSCHQYLYFKTGQYCYFWSSTEVNSYHAWNRYLYYGDSALLRSVEIKLRGLSVRCVSYKEIGLNESLSEEEFIENTKTSYPYREQDQELNSDSLHKRKRIKIGFLQILNDCHYLKWELVILSMAINSGDTERLKQFSGLSPLEILTGFTNEYDPDAKPECSISGNVMNQLNYKASDTEYYMYAIEYGDGSGYLMLVYENDRWIAKKFVFNDEVEKLRNESKGK
ncbi:MAG: fibrobacter succinogenes major paralogous domain-containing protein [Ignavibacteria bacterium]|nr:fibrobacter succinogenes major paralogous domain-containing protein [Ignavibacteria bacterium]